MIFLKASTPHALINQHMLFLKPGTLCVLFNHWNLEEAEFALPSHPQVAQNDDGHKHHREMRQGEQCLPRCLLGNAQEAECPQESLKWTSAREGNDVDERAMLVGGGTSWGEGSIQGGAPESYRRLASMGRTKS